MLSLEEYISKRKREDRINEFDLPNLAPEIQPGITWLQEEQNLRYHYEDLVDIDDLINIGEKVHLFIRALIKNRFEYVYPEKDQANTLFLSYPKKRNAFSFAQFTIVPIEQPLTLADIKIKI